MDLLIEEGAKLAPTDRAEATAIFRSQVIGPLITRDFTSYGEPAHAIRRREREAPTTGCHGQPLVL